MIVLLPHICLNKHGLGCFHFARHYSGNHFCFLFLSLLRCFSSRGSLPLLGNVPSAHWVAPFGDHRIKGYLLLPGAYRSLSRPSSPPRAKASPIRSYLLSSVFCKTIFAFTLFLRIISIPSCQRTFKSNVRCSFLIPLSYDKLIKSADLTFFLW